MYVGVSRSPEEIQRRWLSPSISKLSANPLVNHEPVKLTKLEEVLAGALGLQARATLWASSSLWSTMSKQESVLPRMTLFRRYEVSCPLASHSRPPLSPFISRPRTRPSTSSSSTEWPVELRLILMSSMMTVPSWSIPLLSMSSAGALTESLMSTESSCRSMLSRTTNPCWSSIDVHSKQVEFLPPLITSFDSSK